MTARRSAKLNRRSVLKGASAMAAMTPFSLQAADFAGLSAEVAQKARVLAEGRDVVLRMIIPNGSEANLAPVVKAFTDQTGIKIEVEQTHVDDINTRLILESLSEENSYDVALPATFGLPDLIEADAILPLNAFAERHEPDGFRDGILYAIGDQFDGEYYGFQTDGDAYVMFYNTTFLNDPGEMARYEDSTGQPLGIPQTWSELDRQIAFFHRPDEDIFGGALFRTPGYVGWEWWVRFHAKGMLPFAPDLTPQVAQPQGLEALEEMISVTQYLMPDIRMTGLFANWEKFAKGNVYCNIGWGGTQKYLHGPNSNIRDTLAHGPTPGGLVDGKRISTPYFNWGWDYVVSKRSQEAEIAYLLCLFASTPDISTQSIGQRDGFFDPIRPEHYDDPTIREIYGDAFLAVHRESLENAIPDLYLANQSEYFLVLNEWIDLAIAGEVAPMEALERIEVEWTLITYRSGKEAQQTRWAELASKYPKTGLRR